MTGAEYNPAYNVDAETLRRWVKNLGSMDAAKMFLQTRYNQARGTAAAPAAELYGDRFADWTVPRGAENQAKMEAGYEKYKAWAAERGVKAVSKWDWSKAVWSPAGGAGGGGGDFQPHDWQVGPQKKSSIKSHKGTAPAAPEQAQGWYGNMVMWRPGV